MTRPSNEKSGASEFWETFVQLQIQPIDLNIRFYCLFLENVISTIAFYMKISFLSILCLSAFLMDVKNSVSCLILLSSVCSVESTRAAMFVIDPLKFLELTSRLI